MNISLDYIRICNMGQNGLHYICTQSMRAAGLMTEGVAKYIYQGNHKCPCFNYNYVPLVYRTEST